jgi:diguanylate cyclase (GGDEF)-like protein
VVEKGGSNVAEVPKQLKAWIERSRSWPSLPRVGALLAALRDAYREVFHIPRGAFLMAGPRQWPELLDEALDVHMAWGFDPEELAVLRRLFLSRVWGRSDVGWLPRDALEAPLAAQLDRWRTALLGRWPLLLPAAPEGSVVLFRPHPYPDDQEIIGACTQIANLVLDLMVQRRAAEALSLRDPLTGLWNRRGVLEHLEGVLASARRHGNDLVLAVADVNDLKETNDRLGHQKGDATLKKVAAALASAVRAGDVVGRWGGDEFVLLLEAKGESADAIAERLMRWTAMRTGGQGASVGCAVWGVDGDTFESVFHAADLRCYAAKQAQGPSSLGPR